jgi:hypothetical protein
VITYSPLIFPQLIRHIQDSLKFVTNDELSAKLKDGFSSVKKDMENTSEAFSQKLKQQYNEMNAELEKKVSVFVTQDSFEEVKQTVPELKKNMQGVLKSNTLMTNELKSIKVQHNIIKQAIKQTR